MMKKREHLLTGIEKGIYAVTRSFNWAAAFFVTVMMLLTCADVVLRLFRSPIPGTYEMVGLLGAAFVSFSLANTSIIRGHIAVDFLVKKLSQPAQQVTEIITNLVCALLFGFITWQAFKYAVQLRNTGEVSLTLQMPIYPFIFGIAAGCGMLCIVLVEQCIGSVMRLVWDDSPQNHSS